MKQNLDYLTDDDVRNTCDITYMHKVQEKSLALTKMSADVTKGLEYSIVCPSCRHDNNNEDYNMWPRGVSQKGVDLGSCGDVVSIYFECEHCRIDYTLKIAKRGFGLGISLEQTGYAV